MKRFFTHYWSNDTCRHNRPHQGELLEHTAGNQFRKRKVTPGDAIYVVTVQKGKLMLIGRLTVSKVCGAKEAAQMLATEDLWEADDHVIAAAATRMRFDLEVPFAITERLLFVSPSPRKPLKPLRFVAPGVLDTQTVRGVRQLTDASARGLDELLSGGEPIRFQKTTASFNPAGKEQPRSMRSLPFSESEYKRFSEASCGPLSLAAACGKTLREIQDQIGFPETMNQGEAEDSLRGFGIAYKRDGAGVRNVKPELQSLRDGLAYIQFIGKWMDSGFGVEIARHTHWVASLNGCVFDPLVGYGWLSETEWKPQIEAYSHEDDRRGWFIRAWFELLK